MKFLDKLKSFILRDNNTQDNIIIDVSDEMKPIIKNLIKNYKNFCNYPELLNIAEKDRLDLLKFIWNKWHIHISSIIKSIIEEYPQYNVDDLGFIVTTEAWRLSTIREACQYKESNDRLKEYFRGHLIRYYNHLYRNDTILKLCEPVDMQNIQKVWREDNGKINHIFFKLQGENDKYLKDIKEIYLYNEGRERKVTKEELKNFCEENRYYYPFYVSSDEILDRKRTTYFNQINKIYSAGKISQEKYNELIKKINAPDFD